MVGREENQKYPTVSEAAEEFIKLQDIAFPITTMGFVSYLKGLISVVCLGKLGQLELAGGSLAVGFTNITGYSVLSGLAMGMDPLCSQAFGSRNFPLLALTLQRTILVLLFASVPIGLLWINLEPLMLVLHQNAEITRVASIYCQFVLPDLIANSLLQPLKIYLRSKGNPWPLMWCHLLGVLLHLPITIFLAFNLNLGVPGIAMATFITNFNTLIFLLCYLFFCTASSEEPLVTSLSLPSSSATSTSSLTDEWGNLPLSTPLSLPSSATSLGAEWGTLLRLAIPSCLGVCLEWWWYEFMTIAAGYFHNPQVTLATSAIVIQTTALMYTFPSALSASVSTRVGSELGAGRPKKASLATKVAIVVAILLSAVGLLWTNLGRREWVSIFTQENDVRELTMAVLPIIGLCELANCPQTTGCGVLRGSARPDIGAIINFYSFYIVGAPVAIILGFVLKLGFAGLCYGLLAAQIVCAFSIITVIWMTDWDKESLRAKELVGGGDSWTHEEEEEDQSIKLVEETESLKEVTFQP